MRVLLKLAYDGSNYNGFQRQSGKQKNKTAIQNILEQHISNIYNLDIEVIGASRTDAGVHAMSQYVVYDIEKNHLPIDKIKIILNNKLPKDIRIIESVEVDDNFHPRYNSSIKTYEYKVCVGDFINPLYRNFMLHYPKKVNVQKMNEACKLIVGTHDFIGFSNKSEVKNTVRTIYECNVSEDNEILTFYITGDGFLYNMVRIIVATLLEIGIEKKEIYDISRILEQKNRKLASPTISGVGLCLQHIQYK